jgi:hypothetical protein
MQGILSANQNIPGGDQDKRRELVEDTQEVLSRMQTAFKEIRGTLAKLKAELGREPAGKTS